MTSASNAYSSAAPADPHSQYAHPIGHCALLMDTSASAFGLLLRGLLGRASPEAEAEMGVPFDARLLDSIDLAHHNEGLVGLEILCSNLDEYEITVSEQERHALRAFADAWGLGDRDRRLLDSLGDA